MNLLNRFDLQRKSQAVQDARNLLTANGFDFNLAVANMGKAHKDLVGKADAARKIANDFAAAAEKARDDAANAAADKFQKATKSTADTASLRKSARRLLLITDFFQKWEVTGVLKGFINEVLAFKGITGDVLAEMRQAAAEKRAEADRLDKLAEDAFQVADAARADAEAQIAASFKASMDTVQTHLDKAVEFDALAASMFDTFSRYGGK